MPKKEVPGWKVTKADRNKDSEPITVEIRVRDERIVVTRHIDYPPDRWLMRWGPESHMTQLDAKDLDRAKEEALVRLLQRFEALVSALREAILHNN
jgi:aldehyde:ferredoxin oxidoreductase